MGPTSKGRPKASRKPLAALMTRPKHSQNASKTQPKRVQNASKTSPNTPKTLPKLVQNTTKTRPRIYVGNLCGPGSGPRGSFRASASRVTHRHPLAPAPFGSRALWLHALWLPRPPRRARPLANAAARRCSDVDGSIPHQGLWPPERASAARHFFACAGLMQRQVIPQGPPRYPKTKWRTSEKKMFF